jgi:hypothetical protein
MRWFWYAFQAGIVIWVGYNWTNVPGNNPNDLPHGLGLGWLLAWCATHALNFLYECFADLFAALRRSHLQRVDNRLRLRAERRRNRDLVLGHKLDGRGHGNTTNRSLTHIP